MSLIYRLGFRCERFIFQVARLIQASYRHPLFSCRTLQEDIFGGVMPVNL